MLKTSFVAFFCAFLLSSVSYAAQVQGGINPLTGQQLQYETIDGWKKDNKTENNVSPDESESDREKRYFDEYSEKAIQGDYQAQRNLAWLYSTSKNPFIANLMLGCAWYKLILLSGSPKINDGDIGNVKVYCGKLSPEQQAVTEQQALHLYQEIYQK